MKVHELIQELMRYPLDNEVLIASDEEGNEHHHIADVDPAFWNGENLVHPDDRDPVVDRDNVVVLWP